VKIWRAASLSGVECCRRQQWAKKRKLGGTESLPGCSGGGHVAKKNQETGSLMAQQVQSTEAFIHLNTDGWPS